MKRADTEEIAEREFGEKPDSVEEIVGGLMNRTLRVNYPEESYILQTNEKTEAHEMNNNLNCFKFFKNTKVPVPDIITDQMKEYHSSHYIIVEDLEADSLNEDIEPEVIRASGRYLGHIHNSKSFEKAGWWSWENEEPRIIGFPDNSLKSRIRENLEENLEFFRNENIDWLVKVSKRFLETHIDLVPEEFEPVFVHHDYNPGNILMKDGEIKGIIDFDYAHASHGQRDLAKAANNFWMRGQLDPEHLYEGYNEVRKLKDSFKKNEPVYRLETLIDILKAMIEHGSMTKEEAQAYQETVERLEKKLE